MKKIIILSLMSAMLLGLAGCGPQKISGPIFVINFKEEKTLRYKMVSDRNVWIDLEGSKSGGKAQKMTERLELVMAYTPVEVDPFGLTKVKATCESAKVTRSSFTQSRAAKDAVEYLAGKSFTLILSAKGQIQDFTELDALVKEIGQNAFDQASRQGRVKNPDMIYDFIAMQWSLWDPITNIDDPFNMKPGKIWQAKQIVPFSFPMVSPPARDTTFTLESVTPAAELTGGTTQPTTAKVTSTYTMSETGMENIPYPYDGTFQMRGMFGFLRGYKFDSIEGNGELTFDLDNGTVLSDSQQYELNVTAAFFLPLGDSVPKLRIKQNINIELLDK